MVFPFSGGNRDLIAVILNVVKQNKSKLKIKDILLRLKR